jgi:parvulin-like peptidyl-prolyl isomerase
MTKLTMFVCAATLTIGALLGVTARADVIEQVLVKVNGEIFTKTDLESRQVMALRQQGQTSPDTSDAQLRKMLDDVTPDVIVSVVDEMLLVQRGKELGYTLSNEQFESILTNLKKDNNITTDEEFQAALKQENMTMADLRKQLERQAIIQRVQQNEVLGRVSVSDEESRKYYDTHQSEFTSPQTVTLREIFVSSGDGKTINVGRDEEARQKIDQIRQRALDGESFEKLASDLSDAPSRTNAGLIGPLNMGDISDDVRKLITSMKVGDVSQVLRTPRGYQILKLETMSAAEIMPFEKAREEIGNKVFTDKRNDEFQKYLVKLRGEAIIEWKNQDLKKAYDAGLAKGSKIEG